MTRASFSGAAVISLALVFPYSLEAGHTGAQCSGHVHEPLLFYRNRLQFAGTMKLVMEKLTADKKLLIDDDEKNYD